VKVSLPDVQKALNICRLNRALLLTKMMPVCRFRRTLW
jgi:hypothetical protein